MRAGIFRYSLHHDGECPTGRTPGDGKKPSCSWQLTPGKRGKTINATCLLDHVLPLIEANGKACFNNCSQPLDWKDECYLKCVPKAVMGSTTPPIEPLVRVASAIALRGRSSVVLPAADTATRCRRTRSGSTLGIKHSLPATHRRAGARTLVHRSTRSNAKQSFKLAYSYYS